MWKKSTTARELRAIKYKSLAHVIYVVWDSEPTTRWLFQPFIRIPQHMNSFLPHLNFQFHAHHSDKMVFWFGSRIKYFISMHSQPCRFYRKNAIYCAKIMHATVSLYFVEWHIHSKNALKRDTFHQKHLSMRCFMCVWCVVWHCWFRCNLKWALSIWRDLSTDTSMSKCERWRKETTLKGQNSPSILEEKWFLLAFIFDMNFNITILTSIYLWNCVRICVNAHRKAHHSHSFINGKMRTSNV